ncbi:MAG: Enoyl-CoA hydratase/isomerase family protein [Thermodesulfobacteriota bacterium]|nr:Enoyl-CoA hydratase/isomerase family protein [Thermodesulfobacteriota bacterium]
MADDMLLVQAKGRVCTLVLNCPEKRNALNKKLLLELTQELERLSRDDDIRVIVIRGSGEEAFCSGYDINALTVKDGPEGGESGGRSDAFAPFGMAVEAVMNYPYPVIAMLNGYAFGGGCELAVSCDLRVGGDHIRMGMTPAKIGMIYTPEGLMRFIRTIGLSHTKQIFFTGRTYDARSAKDMGLLDYLVPEAEIEPFTYDLAEEIAANAPLSLKGIKRMLNLILRSDNMGAGDVKEAEEIVRRVMESHDLKEGQAAFLEKRPPQFRGV